MLVISKYFKTVIPKHYLVIPQFGESVVSSGENGLQESKLGVEAQEKQHDEEEDRPESRNGQPRQGLGVYDKC